MQYALETVFCVVSSGFSLLHENTGKTDKHKMVNNCQSGTNVAIFCFLVLASRVSKCCKMKLNYTCNIKRLL